MRYRLLFLSFFISVCLHLSAQEEHGLVKWLTLKEAQEKNKLVPKPIIIDVYTDWCGWCKHMIKTTYSNPGIANYINTNFYPVKFDAETKDTIEYNGKIYKPLSPAPRQAHELAIKLLGGNMSYPTSLFVTNNYEYTLLVPGYLDEKKIEPLLVFMVENAWKNSPYEEFSKHFTNTFYDTTFAKAPVKTYDIREIEKLQKKNPKKILVNFGAEFCNTCRIMKQTTFVDTSLAAYINKNYYLVNFDAGSKDTVVFNGVKSFNTLVNNFPLHTLGMQLSGNRFSLPTLCMLDEQFNTIDALNFYQSPERLKPILTYIASNAYKSKNFNDFMQEYMKPAPPAEVKRKK